MYHLLSYPIEAHMPAWPDSPQLQLEKKLQIAKGDVANTSIISLYNHVGTHYDAPNHYLASGTPIAELDLDRFIFERPLLLEIPKGAGEKVTAADLEPYAGDIARSDLLMIYTGFSRLRLENEALFERNGPGIGSDCAAWLVEHGTGLRALAVDFVSLASFSDQEGGNEAHRILFRGKDGRFICGIEDVNMAPVVGKTLKRVFALPLLERPSQIIPTTTVESWDYILMTLDALAAAGIAVAETE